jgi:hypothetical protein
MINKIKELGESILSLALDQFKDVRITDVYDAGLPDVKGPKKMKIHFSKDKINLEYFELGIIPRNKKITIYPKDILELEIGVEKTENASNTLKGALIGGVLMGGLGAVVGASQFSKQRKEDSLHLVINYKGEARAIYFQEKKNVQKLYAEFKKHFTPKVIEQKADTIIVNTIKPNNSNDIVKQLTDLNNLVQQGILTQQEFDIQKQKLLNK